MGRVGNFLCALDLALRDTVAEGQNFFLLKSCFFGQKRREDQPGELRILLEGVFLFPFIVSDNSSACVFF